MARSEVEFIGRKEEVEIVLDAIFAWNTQKAIFIQGHGGVGKTQLMKEINRQLPLRLEQLAQHQKQYRIIKIDLDDVHLQSPEDISLMMIKQVGMGGTEQYVQALRVLQRLEQVFSTKVPDQRGRVEETFIQQYSVASYGIRTIVFCDTTDAATTEPAREALLFLIHLSRNLPNSIAIFSGQNAEELYESNRQESEIVDSQLLPIRPLSQQEGQKYLRQKQEVLQIVIEPRIAQNIVFLCRGVPFLIDLAAEWRAREIPSSWLTAQTLRELRSMPKEEAAEQQKKFEALLVKHMTQGRRPLDRLALAMAWVHPVDVKLCARLLDCSEEEAKKLMIDAQSVPFIKTLPDGQIKLHDYMEDLVLLHVWRGIEEGRKRRISERAIEHFGNMLKELGKRRSVTGRDPDDRSEKMSESVDAFLTREAAEREYWQIGSKLLEHQLFVDATRGAHLFCELFDEASRSQRVSILGEMSVATLQQRRQLHWNTWFEVNIRYATYLQNRRRYSEAEAILNEGIDSTELSPSQEVRALVARGNTRSRLVPDNPIGAGLQDFYQAIAVASANRLQKELAQAELEVGWAYSSSGDYVEANEHFKQAIELAWALDDRELEATLLNELAYTRFPESFRGALSLCDEAINMWKELGDRPGLGRAYSNKGTILYRAGDFDKAQEFFSTARDIFERMTDPEWIGIISSWQGITYCAQVEREGHTSETGELLRKAEELLDFAVDIDVYRERARNLNRLARVYRIQERRDETWSQLQKAYEASLDIPDFIYEVATLRDLSSMALELADFSVIYADLRAKLERCQKSDISLLPHGIAYGGALVNIGMMGIYLGDTEFGFKSVGDGLRYSAEAGNYASFTFAKALHTFRALTDRLVAQSDRRELAVYLKQYWDREDLGGKYLEATRVFHKL